MSKQTIASYVIEDIKKIATAFEGISQFRPDAHVSFSKNGVALSTIDKQHVMLIDLVYSAIDMADSVAQDVPTRMHFDVKALASTLKLAVKRGHVNLVVEQYGMDRTLKVTVEGSEFAVNQAPHDTRLADADLEPTKELPSVTITMTCKEAKRIFKELLSFDSDVMVTCNKDKQTVTLSCEGAKGSATMVIRDGSEGVQDVIIDNTVCQKFDCKYLQKIIKQDVGNKLVTIRLRKGMPIEVCHAMSDDSHLAFHLAPKCTE